MIIKKVVDLYEVDNEGYLELYKSKESFRGNDIYIDNNMESPAAVMKLYENIYFLINPKYYSVYSEEEKEVVWLHELGHVLCGHLEMVDNNEDERMAHEIEAENYAFQELYHSGKIYNMYSALITEMIDCLRYYDYVAFGELTIKMDNFINNLPKKKKSRYLNMYTNFLSMVF